MGCVRAQPATYPRSQHGRPRVRRGIAGVLRAVGPDTCRGLALDVYRKSGGHDRVDVRVDGDDGRASSGAMSLVLRAVLSTAGRGSAVRAALHVMRR